MRINDFLKKRHTGFTLLELLVVVAIIGLFSSIVMASVSKVRKDSRNTFRNESVGEFIKAAYLYHSTYGAYPSSGDQYQYCLAEVPTTCKYFGFDTSSSNILNVAFSEYIKVDEPFPMVGNRPTRKFEGPFWDCNEDAGDCLISRITWFLEGDAPCGNGGYGGYDAYGDTTLCMFKF